MFFHDQRSHRLTADTPWAAAYSALVSTPHLRDQVGHVRTGQRGTSASYADRLILKEE